MPGYVALKPLHSGSSGSSTLNSLNTGLNGNRAWQMAHRAATANGLAPQIESVGAQGSGTSGKKDAKTQK